MKPNNEKNDEDELYVKKRLLGEGAFGKAYLVERQIDDKQFVLKQMDLKHMSQKEKEETE